MIARVLMAVAAASLAIPLSGCKPHPQGTTAGTGRTAPPGVLTPGPGWNATWVATPAAQGSANDRGYDEMPSAKFDEVPYQVVRDTMRVCVIAGKGPTQAQYDSGVTNAIAHVSLSDDNGPWLDVPTAMLNRLTGVTEYCADVRAADHKDGPHEVRAIVYPLTGAPRVLQGEASAQPAPSFTGHISGATLTVDTVPSAGVLQPGASLLGISIYAGTIVTAQTDSTHYTVNRDYGSPGVPTEAITGIYERNDDAYGLIFVTNAQGSIPMHSIYVAPADDPMTPGADNDTCGAETAPCATLLQGRQRLKAIIGGKVPEVGGSTIYLAPNTADTPTYEWPNPPSDNGLSARYAWLNIDKWPGRDGAVSFSGGMGKTGPRIEKVRLGDVTIIADNADLGGNDGPRPGTSTIQSRGTALFCDGTTFIGQGLQAPNAANFPFRNTRWPGGTYARNCDVSNYTNGPLGAELIQGGRVHNLLSDALTYSRMVVNVEVTDLVSGQSAHPDVAQYSGDLYQIEGYVHAAGDGVLHVTQITHGDPTTIRPGMAVFTQQQDNVALVGAGHWITRQIPTQSGDFLTYELNDKSMTLNSGGVFLGTITAGSGGTDGTYANVQLTGGTGTSPIASIKVNAGAVASVTITSAGKGKNVGEVLTAPSSAIGGVTGFSYAVTQLTNLIMFTSPRWNVIVDGLHGGYQATITPAVGGNINGQCAYPNQNVNFDFMFAHVQVDNSINPGRTCVSANGYIENFLQLDNDWKGGPNKYKTDEFNFKYVGRNNTIVDSLCHDYPFNYPNDGSVLALEKVGPNNCSAASSSTAMGQARAQASARRLSARGLKLLGDY